MSTYAGHEDVYFCCFCGHTSSPEEECSIQCDVREFSHLTFPVWRCQHCHSLHSKEPIDFALFYERYPIKHQKFDFFTKRLMASRLKQLEKITVVTKDSLILDYGCGSGAFVRYLQSKGFYKVVGYDPYSEIYNTPEVLNKKYDLVLSQDVLEHTPSPRDYLLELKQHVKDDGVLCIGTPDADNLDLFDIYDQIGRIHQPYHRHIPSQRYFRQILQSVGLEITGFDHAWHADTCFPFLNSRFMFHYMKSLDSTLDVMFEPIRILRIFMSPSLMFWGLFGGAFRPQKDFAIALKKERDLS